MGMGVVGVVVAVHDAVGLGGGVPERVVWVWSKREGGAYKWFLDVDLF